MYNIGLNYDTSVFGHGLGSIGWLPLTSRDYSSFHANSKIR